jgi:DNA polymerase I-like protein with 3'-5' exonuclease and polymerase domains
MLDIPKFQRRTARVTIPQYDTSWQPPKDFPNLNNVKSIAVDVETYDPELKTAGPGWARGSGELVGFSLATKDASWYFPIRHRVQAERNLNPEQALRWLKDIMERPIPKIGANLYYDVGWLAQEGIDTKGILYDVQIAERLLDSSKFKYDLDSIAQKYCGDGKISEELYEWCAQAYGGKPNSDQRANIYRAPPSLVGPYAEADASLPYEILTKQWEELERLELLKVFDIESRLTPLLVKMRMRGVRISEEKAHLAKYELQNEIDVLQHKLNEMAGFNVNVNAAQDLEKLFKKAGVQIQYTAEGNPSFRKEWLEREPHPAAHIIREIRQYTKTVSTFIEGAILEKHVNGRVYGQFKQSNTITGRFSSSDPNLQNIPKRNKKIKAILRGIFLPEEGTDWLDYDYSSIEFRIFAHFAHEYLNDETIWSAYQDDPTTDFHQVVTDMVGGNLPRVAYKTLSFTSMYAGGRRALTKQMHLNFTEEQQRQLIEEVFGAKVLSNPSEQLAVLIGNLYHDRFPIVKDMLNYTTELAERFGETRTVLGRRVTFDLYEPKRGRGFPLPYNAARRAYGSQIKRANTYKALNYINQGSAADVMKAAMVAAFESGLLDDNKLGPFHLTVHDSVSISATKDQQKELLELKDILENTVKISVPLLVDVQWSDSSWGDIKDFDLATWRIIDE